MFGPLEQLVIKYFQSHGHTVLDFHPGVNVILGQSQSGKTGILRSFILLVRNRPLGFRFHSHFDSEGEDTEITAKFPDVEVKFIKDSSGGAEYSIDNGEPFSGGKTVPDKVIEALNISETNIQEQLEQPFLITSSPGEVAKVINRITRLDEVDGWVSELTTLVNTCNSDMTSLTNSIVEKQERLEEFKIVAEIDKRVKEIEEAEKDLVSLQERESVLQPLIDNYKSVSEGLQDSRDWLEGAEKGVLELEAIQKEFVDLEGREVVLETLIDDYRKAESKLEKSRELSKADDTVKEIESLIIEWKEVREREKMLGWVVQEWGALNQNVGIAKERTIEAKEHLYDFVSSLGLCPLCFSKLDEKQIQKVMEGI